MISATIPTVRVAAIQASPVFLDVNGSISKLEGLVQEASANGAQLVVFGESFLAGFPIWNGVLPPVEQHELHERLYRSSITVPSGYVHTLGDIAAAHKVVLSVGINERAGHTLGQIFNANLIFDRDGRLVNHRRKLIGTWYERLTWSHGDAHDLKPVDLNGWGLGALICGENTNTLARYSLLAQGERLHIATYPPAWPFDQRQGLPEYDLEDSIRLRSAAHCFEGKVFSIVAATALDDDAAEAVAMGDRHVASLLRSTPTASMIVGPRGETLAGPLREAEGILYATVDLAQEIALKQAHDIVGTYQRLDLFELKVDTSRPRSITVIEQEPSVVATGNLQETAREHDGP
jgi:nitrilase